MTYDIFTPVEWRMARFSRPWHQTAPPPGCTLQWLLHPGQRGWRCRNGCFPRCGNQASRKAAAVVLGQGRGDGTADYGRGVVTPMTGSASTALPSVRCSFHRPGGVTAARVQPQRMAGEELTRLALKARTCEPATAQSSRPRTHWCRRKRRARGAGRVSALESLVSSWSGNGIPAAW